MEHFVTATIAGVRKSTTPRKIKDLGNELISL